MEMENLDRTKEVKLLQEALNGLVIQVDARITKRDIVGMAMMSAGAALIGMTAYSELRGWALKRKLKKQMNNFMNES